MLNKKILIGFLFVLCLCTYQKYSFADYGEYYYLAEKDCFGDSTFFVNKNITVFENGGVLQENWEHDLDKNKWILRANYWCPQDSTYSSTIAVEIGKDPESYEKQSQIELNIIQFRLQLMDSTVALSLPLLRADVYDTLNDTTKSACVIIPGYTLGLFSSNSQENKGWNNGGGASGSYKYVTDSINKGYESSAIVVINFNTHEDYDGRSCKESTSDNQEYNGGILWGNGGPGSGNAGALDKALYMLQNRLGIKLEESRIVSHSTGYYLSKKMLSEILVKEYWATSPLTRGSTLIRTMAILRQRYDCWEDMIRHKYGVPEESVSEDFYNSCIVDLANLPVKNDSTDANFLLSHGDASTGGQSGWSSGITSNMGVVSYSNLQYTYDTFEIARRRKFLKYEAMSNMDTLELKNFNNYKITVWDNRTTISDGWLEYFITIFGPVLLRADIEDVYEHIDLDQRMEVIGAGNEQLGALKPANIYENKYSWTSGEKGIKDIGIRIKWTQGSDDGGSVTEKYEIARRAVGEVNWWNVGEVGYDTTEFYDSLRSEIILMAHIGNDSTEIWFSRDEYSDSSLINKKVFIADGDGKDRYYNIVGNEKNKIICKGNLSDDGVKCKFDRGLWGNGDRFIIKGINYEYSVRTWGAKGTNLDKEKGVFLSVGSNEVVKNEDTTSSNFKKKTEIKRGTSGNFILGFILEDEETPIHSARYRIGTPTILPPPAITAAISASKGNMNTLSSTSDTSYTWGSWIDLVPADGMYDSLEESFETTISTLGLTQGNHKIEVAAEDAMENAAYDTLDWIYDFTMPTIVSLKDGNDYSIPQNGFTNSDSVTVYAYDTLSGLKEIKFTGPDSFESSYLYSGETTYVTATFSGLPEGNCTVSVFDQAGNNNFRNFTYDSTSPEITSYLPYDSTYSTTSLVNFYAKIVDEGCGIDTASLKLIIGNETSYVFDTVVFDSGFNTVEINYSTTFLNEGFYSWNISAKDKAGNEIIESYSLVYETTIQGVYNIFPPDGFVTDMNDQNISASIHNIVGLNISTIKIEIEGKTKTITEDVEKYIYDTKTIEIRYQPQSTILLEEGKNKWKVIGQDLTGNDINDSTHILIVDTEPPVIEIISPSSTTIKSEDWFK